MIKLHNIAPDACFHPSMMGYPISVPGSSAGAIVAAIADTSAVVGTPLTLVTSATAGVGPAGYIPGSPCAIAFTPGVTVVCTFTVVGIDQFGIQRTETIVTASSTVIWTQYAYRQILSITPTVLSASGNNISVGFVLTSGFKIGLPFQPASVLQGSTTLASFQQALEVVGLVTNGGSAFVQTAASAIDAQRSTLKLSATVTAGFNWLLTKYISKGAREK